MKNPGRGWKGRLTGHQAGAGTQRVNEERLERSSESKFDVAYRLLASGSLKPSPSAAAGVTSG